MMDGAILLVTLAIPVLAFFCFRAWMKSGFLSLDEIRENIEFSKKEANRKVYENSPVYREKLANDRLNRSFAAYDRRQKDLNYR